MRQGYKLYKTLLVLEYFNGVKMGRQQELVNRDLLGKISQKYNSWLHEEKV